MHLSRALIEPNVVVEVADQLELTMTTMSKKEKSRCLEARIVLINKNLFSIELRILKDATEVGAKEISEVEVLHATMMIKN